jgi:hypothetical protein
VQRLITGHLGRVASRAGLSPHLLRHTVATHLLARMSREGSGKTSSAPDIRAVQELLGHVSLSSTQVYTHITVDRLRRAVRWRIPGERSEAHAAAPTRDPTRCGSIFRGRLAPSGGVVLLAGCAEIGPPPGGPPDLVPPYVLAARPDSMATRVDPAAESHSLFPRRWTGAASGNGSA